MNIKLIADGSTPEDRQNENWGVSFLVGGAVLFDTFGKPEKFLNNLRVFGVDIAGIRNIVISHDDWDHVSGLKGVLELNKRAKVYLCPHTDNQVIDNIKTAGAKIIDAQHMHEIITGICTAGELKALSEGRIVYEQALIVKSPRGVTVVTGCAHPGIVRIVEDVTERIGIRPYCVIGGFHLKNTPLDEVERIVKQLKELQVRKVCPLHCTGEAAVKLMKDVFGEGCVQLKEGENIEV